jgi:hypothetical protein
VSWREILEWIAIDENAIAQQIVDSALRVRTALGLELLEPVYRAALAYELGGYNLTPLTPGHNPLLLLLSL